MNSKELVLNALMGRNHARIPRQLWVLPWAREHYPRELKEILRQYPEDIVSIKPLYEKPKTRSGDMHEQGDFTDDWGCRFHNIQRGIIGEVKEPLVKEPDWNDATDVHIPVEWLRFDVNQFNKSIQNAGDKFTICGLYPRLFEQLQFIRGSEDLFIDLATNSAGLRNFMEQMHAFYCAYLTRVCDTEIDAIFFMDDWGSQTSLLIDPAMWRNLFKPLYGEYIEIAHRAGKKAFMHSDGYILPILPDLIDIGLDAINCQIFCIGVKNLSQFRGEITFWGEMDRQFLLPHGTSRDIENAVQDVYDNLYKDGGCIAQCEFGLSAKPENIMTMFRTWVRIGQGQR